MPAVRRKGLFVFIWRPGSRRATSVSTVRVSRRASSAPRQWCLPQPSAKCRLGQRRGSNVFGSDCCAEPLTASSRLAAANQIATVLPAGTSRSPNLEFFCERRAASLATGFRTGVSLRQGSASRRRRRIYRRRTRGDRTRREIPERWRGWPRWCRCRQLRSRRGSRAAPYRRPLHGSRTAGVALALYLANGFLPFSEGFESLTYFGAVPLLLE